MQQEKNERRCGRNAGVKSEKLIRFLANETESCLIYDGEALQVGDRRPGLY